MIVLVTGGASGLGEAITRRCAQDTDCTVYFTYNRSDANAKKIGADHPNAIAIKCNFKDASDVACLKEQIGKVDIDVLVNNAYAGTFLKTYFHKIAPSDFLIEYQENIIPTIEITQAALTCFRKKKSGKVITILTSALLNIPPIGSAVYVANKAYLAQLSKLWAAENAKYNIACNTVSPSFMQTNFTSDTDERIIEQMQSEHPLKSILTTAEVAETVFFLAKASNHVNGADIVINSAISIR